MIGDCGLVVDDLMRRTLEPGSSLISELMCTRTVYCTYVLILKVQEKIPSSKQAALGSFQRSPEGYSNGGDPLAHVQEGALVCAVVQQQHAVCSPEVRL